MFEEKELMRKLFGDKQLRILLFAKLSEDKMFEEIVLREIGENIFEEQMCSPNNLFPKTCFPQQFVSSKTNPQQNNSSN